MARASRAGFRSPFRNCECPAPALFARAGTMLPILWDFHAQRTASHLRCTSSALYHQLVLSTAPGALSFRAVCETVKGNDANASTPASFQSYRDPSTTVGRGASRNVQSSLRMTDGWWAAPEVSRLGGFHQNPSLSAMSYPRLQKAQERCIHFTVCASGSKATHKGLCKLAFYGDTARRTTTKRKALRERSALCSSSQNSIYCTFNVSFTELVRGLAPPVVALMVMG